MQNLIINITQENFELLKAKDLGCFILVENLSENFVRNFINQAHENEKICLFSGKNAGEKYAEFSADGVILDLCKEEKPQKIIKEFKKKNPKALLGVVSRNKRHEAMLISECEPEFIIFKIWSDGLEKSKELLEWYNEFFLIQSAVLPMENCKVDSLIADFVIKNDADL